MNDQIIMGHYVTNQQLIVGAVVLVVLVAIAIGAFIQSRKARTVALRSRYGSEYERAVVAHTAPLARPKQNWPTGKLA